MTAGDAATAEKRDDSRNVCEFCDKPSRAGEPLRWHRAELDVVLAHRACAHVYDGLASIDRPF